MKDAVSKLWRANLLCVNIKGAGQALVLVLVGGEDCMRVPLDKVRVLGHNVQAIRVDDHRQLFFSHEAKHLRRKMKLTRVCDSSLSITRNKNLVFSPKRLSAPE